MIRYHEQTGLIPKAGRTDSGYRDYSPLDVEILLFIRRTISVSRSRRSATY